jgi:hypothetical protein
MDQAIKTAGVLLITIPAVEFGGLTLLKFLARRVPGYMDNPMRRGLWRAGHAHAGVLIVFALVAMIYLGEAQLSDGLTTLVRTCFVLAPILMPLGFFLSVASPRAERPNALIALVPLGGVALGVGAVTLGIALVT